MKKFLFLIFIFSQSNFCAAQTAFNSSTSFKENNLFGKTFLHSKAKKKNNFISAYGLNFKISAHGTNLFSKEYTPDTFYIGQVYRSIYYLYHYKFIPSVQFNYSLNFKLFFLNNKFFIEGGIKTRGRFKNSIIKVDGSYIPDSASMSHIFFPPVPDLSKVNKEIHFQRHLEFPILIGVRLNHFQFSIGTYRSIYYWDVTKDFSDTQTKRYFWRDYFNYPSTPLNPIINISAEIVGKKFKVLPFISIMKKSGERNPYFELGLELGYNFKEKK